MDTTEQDRVAQLQQQAADDYAQAQTDRAWQTHRDDANLHGPDRNAAR